VREELEKLLSAEPFVPFQITMASGRIYDVRNPGLTSIAGDMLYVMHLDPDTHSVLRLAQISSFDTIA
jgi:hypothetical protein